MREFFEDRAEITYQEALDYIEHLRNTDPEFLKLRGDRVLKPNEPGFTANCSLEEAESFGYLGIPDPTNGDQPLHIIVGISNGLPDKFLCGMEGDSQRMLLIEPHQVGYVFSLDKPIALQVESAKQDLLVRQFQRHGKRLQKRRHPSKWMCYLRMLDAREAGATWSELSGSDFLPNTANKAQTARDVWQQARALCFNF